VKHADLHSLLCPGRNKRFELYFSSFCLAALLSVARDFCLGALLMVKVSSWLFLSSPTASTSPELFLARSSELSWNKRM